jgi:hypothetical protein
MTKQKEWWATQCLNEFMKTKDGNKTMYEEVMK